MQISTLGLFPIFCQYEFAVFRILNAPVMQARTAFPSGTTIVICFIAFCLILIPSPKGEGKWNVFF
jgi:hypothetical protein